MVDGTVVRRVDLHLPLAETVQRLLGLGTDLQVDLLLLLFQVHYAHNHDIHQVTAAAVVVEVGDLWRRAFDETFYDFPMLSSL